MDQQQLNQKIEELTLLLLYLTHWTEKGFKPSEPIHRSWKGYSFDALNKLVDEGYLVGVKHPGSSKSVIFTDEGLTKAKELEKKYLK
ncbi:MAG: hypothetical protein A2474_08300 [Elusimicrobia bacterium RIFOXYC2_FULL_34_12]|nr:MAG: hypothetical protein A2474_08300 [Elusimicrobia bacterium RIFOXYC2_FULL_34_12]OGS46078.1 MAG: hypothetical protein A2539_05955 [Elusimicrobia bacterium RIFOXYD2_FULL_34_15]HAM38322.1 transposase [Elusimicrobiota bacterium]